MNKHDTKWSIKDLVQDTSRVTGSLNDMAKWYHFAMFFTVYALVLNISVGVSLRIQCCLRTLYYQKLLGLGRSAESIVGKPRWPSNSS